MSFHTGVKRTEDEQGIMVNLRKINVTHIANETLTTEIGDFITERKIHALGTEKDDIIKIMENYTLATREGTATEIEYLPTEKDNVTDAESNQMVSDKGIFTENHLYTTKGKCIFHNFQK